MTPEPCEAETGGTTENQCKTGNEVDVKSDLKAWEDIQYSTDVHIPLVCIRG